MPKLPTGTVTFLFTDIEGSTVRWESHPEAMRAAVAQHDMLLRRVMQEQNGLVFKTAGDAFYVVFTAAPDALVAAVSAQRALVAEVWPQEVVPLLVRMAIHTGAAEQRNNDYFGPPLNRVARILSAGHGGQILLSSTARGLLREDHLQGITLRDLGEYRLKGLAQPDRIFQVVVADLPAEFSPLNTSHSLVNNLPVQLTPFIGRGVAQEIVAQLLLREDVRLVTLIGPGGIGKTRLGVRVATNVAEFFSEGIYFVDLSTTLDPAAVLSTMGQAFGIREVGAKPLLERLKELFQGQVLLVLDNFEQVAEAAPLLMELLRCCSGLKALVTSREALALTGEHEYAVGPLDLPAANPHSDLAQLVRYDAIALFVQHATSVKLDFQLTRLNAVAVVEICRKLDGLPLAIELAAARTKMFSPQALLKLLKRRMQVLKDEKRDRTERQQTLRGAIAWSYDLLNSDEKKLFAQLAVFNGGCTLEAIVVICPAVGELTGDLFDVLKSLVDKSLVRQQDAEGDEPRFTMLHTIRDFALDRLISGSDADVLQDAHRDYYLNVAEEAVFALTSTAQRHSLEQLETEHDNLVAALQWSADRGQTEPGARLAGALWRFWLMRGYFHEGRRWLDIFLSTDGACLPAARVKLLEGAGILAVRQKEYQRAAQFAQEALTLGRSQGSQEAIANACTLLAEIASAHGDNQRAMTLFEEGLTIRRALGDKRGTASLLNNMGNVALDAGESERAVTLFEESRVLFGVVGDELAQASVLNNLGEVERRQNNSERARLLYEQSLLLSRALKYTWGIAAALLNLGGIASSQNDYPRALNYYRESLGLFEQMGGTFGLLLCLEGIAEIAYARDNLEYATRVLSLVETLRQSLDTPPRPFTSGASAHTSATLRTALGAMAFENIWRAGQTYPLDEAIADALAIELLSS